MPLHKGKSKQAFSKNVEIEMKHGKPQNQALAIAYSVKRKSKKASGGTVKSGSKDMNYAKGGPVSAKSESRANADMQDMSELSRNRGDKAPSQDSWTDRGPERSASKGPKTTRIKHPSMAQSPIFKVSLRDQEDDLQDSAGVNDGPQRQPRAEDDEIGPDRQGPKVSDMQDEHSTHRKPYAKGGMIDSMDHKSKHDMEPDDSGIQEREREDEAHLESMESPSEDEGDADAMSLDEEGQDRQGPDTAALHMKRMAHGGDIDGDGEMDMEHEDSIAAAIMARRDRMHAEIDSGAHDLDMAVKMAEGGEVDLDENSMEQPNGFYEQNEDAALKENYDEGMDDAHTPMDGEDGDKREDETSDPHDMVSSIRSKMKAKRQFKAR